MRLVASGRQRLDDVEIACTAPDLALVIRDKAARHGWPVTLSAGVPAVQTRPGRALLAFLGWAERRFPAGALRRLFQSGDVTLVPDEPPSPGQAARLLARSGATWDRATYARALEALAAESERRAAGAEQDDDAAAAYRERARQARKVGEVIQALLALVPLPDERGNVELGAVLAGSCTLLERHAAVTSDVGAAAREALRRTFDELAVLSTLALPLGDAIRLLSDRVRTVRVDASRARPGALHVTSLAQAGWAGRPYTFVVGLEEGHVLPAALEDPVLLDDEREHLDALLGLGLRTSRDRVSEALHGVVNLIR